jgi:hypothetical protein
MRLEATHNLSDKNNFLMLETIHECQKKCAERLQPYWKKDIENADLKINNRKYSKLIRTGIAISGAAAGSIATFIARGLLK